MMQHLIGVSELILLNLMCIHLTLQSVKHLIRDARYMWAFVRKYIFFSWTSGATLYQKAPSPEIRESVGFN